MTIAARKADAVVYIEGVRIPINAWSATGGVGGASSCTLSVNPSKAARELLPGSHVALFVKDLVRGSFKDQEVDPSREFPLGSATGLGEDGAPDPDASHPDGVRSLPEGSAKISERLDNENQRGLSLLFEGFLVGSGYQIHSSGTRGVQLICKGLSTAWEQTKQQWGDMSVNYQGMVEDLITNNFDGAETKWSGPVGIQSFILGTMERGYTGPASEDSPGMEEGKLIEILKIRDSDDEVVGPIESEDFLHYFINILELFGNVCAYYSTERNRWRLTDRIQSIPSGESLRLLFAETTFSKLFRGQLSRMTGSSSIYQVVSTLLQMIQHDVVETLAPSLTLNAPVKRKENGVAEISEATGAFARDVENPIGCPTNIIVKPQLWSAPPPSCNVVFNDLLSELSYQRVEYQEPTRQIAFPSGSIFDTTRQRYWGITMCAPDVIAAFTDMNEATDAMGSNKSSGSSTSDGEQPEGDTDKFGPWHFITNEEKFRGISLANLGAFPLPGQLDEKEEPEEEKRGIQSFAQDSLDAHFLKSRYRGRSLSASGPLNIRPVPGFPILFFDDSESKGHIVGYLASIEHAQDAGGADTTKYNVLMPRYIDEEDLNAPKRGEDEEAPEGEFVDHTIQEGEVVRGITAHYNTSYQAVLEANPWLFDATRERPGGGGPIPSHPTLKDEHLVFPGEVLRVPLVDMSATSEYVVQPRDTIDKLVERFSVDEDDFRAENQDKIYRTRGRVEYLVVGDTLKIPGMSSEEISESGRDGKKRNEIIRVASPHGVMLSQFYRIGSPNVPAWYANQWRTANPNENDPSDADSAGDAAGLTKAYRTILGHPVTSCTYDGDRIQFNPGTDMGVDWPLYADQRVSDAKQGINLLEAFFGAAASSGTREAFIDSFTQRRLVTIAELFEWLGCVPGGGADVYRGGCFDGAEENFPFEVEKWEAMIDEAEEHSQGSLEGDTTHENRTERVKIDRSRRILRKIKTGRLSYPMTFAEVYRTRRERALNYHAELNSRKAFRG
jgi:hypothetical protein